MAACEICGAGTLLMVNVALGATPPTYTYRCPQGHVTRTPSQQEGRHSSVTDAPVTPPPPPLQSPDGGVAGSPPESWPTGPSTDGPVHP